MSLHWESCWITFYLTERPCLKAKAVIDILRSSIKIAKCDTNKFAWCLRLILVLSEIFKDKKFQDAGLGKNVLIHLSITFRAANKTSVNIIRVFKAFIKTFPKNEVISCNGGLVLLWNHSYLLTIYTNCPTVGSQLLHQHSKVVSSLN